MAELFGNILDVVDWEAILEDVLKGREYARVQVKISFPRIGHDEHVQLFDGPYVGFKHELFCLLAYPSNGAQCRGICWIHGALECPRIFGEIL